MKSENIILTNEMLYVFFDILMSIKKRLFLMSNQLKIKEEEEEEINKKIKKLKNLKTNIDKLLNSEKRKNPSEAFNRENINLLKKVVEISNLKINNIIFYNILEKYNLPKIINQKIDKNNEIMNELIELIDEKIKYKKSI